MVELYETIFTYALYGSYILYIIALLGITTFAPEYLDELRNFIKIYIAFILIIKFNPFIKYNKYLSNFDRKVVFSAGIYLLFTTSIIAIIETNIDKIPVLNDLYKKYLRV